MNEILKLAAKILGLVLLLLVILSCLPVFLLILLILAVTGNVGSARNVIWARTSFGRSAGRTQKNQEPEENSDDTDTIDAEVINAETIEDGDNKTDASTHTKNRLTR